MRLVNSSISPIIMFGLSLSLTLVWVPSKSQERVIDRSFNVWMSSVTKYKLHQKWYFKSEIHVRRANGFCQWQQFLVRPGLNFILNENAELSLGYSYILSYPYGNQPIPITTPEHNIWEQALLKHKIGKIGFNHRYRFEQRFQGNQEMNSEGDYSIHGFQLVERFRYRLTLLIPIAWRGRWFISIFDEVMINQSDFVPISFNQNWVYLGLGFKFTQRGAVQLGYFDPFIRKPDGVHFEHNPTAQFTISYTLGKLSESTN